MGLCPLNDEREPSLVITCTGVRHARGFKQVANDGHGTRAIQHYLGHWNIALRQRQSLTREDRRPGIAARLVEAWES